MLLIRNLCLTHTWVSTPAVFCYPFFITVAVWVSLRAPRLFPKDHEVNGRVNFQWP